MTTFKNTTELLHIQHMLELSLNHAKTDLAQADDRHDVDCIEFLIAGLKEAIESVEGMRSESTPILDSILDSFEHITI